MIVERLSISDVWLFHLESHPDERGVFTEVYRKEWLPGIVFVQDNASLSVTGVLRGLHYQIPPKGMGKYIRCVQGLIWDVAVDIRRGSPTFGQHISVSLGPEDALWVPPGFAHGFLSLKNSLVTYKCTATYDAKADRGINALDPTLHIVWAGPVRILSTKDIRLPLLKDVDTKFRYTHGR